MNTDIASPELGAVEVHGMTRASFILRGAMAAGAAYGVAAVGPYVSDAFAAGSRDIDILNFALTLEYLETDFYKVKGASVRLSGEAKSLRAVLRRRGGAARRGADRRDQGGRRQAGGQADVRLPGHRPGQLPQARLRAGEHRRRRLQRRRSVADQQGASWRRRDRSCRSRRATRPRSALLTGRPDHAHGRVRQAAHQGAGPGQGAVR